MRIITEGLQFPEGPIALEDGTFIVVEIRRQTLTHIDAKGKQTVIAKLGGGPNGAAMGPDGYCYVVNNGGFKFVPRADGKFVTAGTPDDYVTGRVERVDIQTGKAEVVYDKVGNQKIRGPNDIVFDAHGGFYFSDPGKVRHRDWDRGCVCYAKADGSMIKELIFPITKPNGVGLSPDGSTLYVAETESGKLWAWELAGPGELKSPAVASTTSPHGGKLISAVAAYRRFDSLAVEANGNICVGTLDSGGITVCSPNGGAGEFVPVPGDTHCTNIAFGGLDHKTAYVTQSYAGRLVEVPWPRPGLKLEGDEHGLD
ncbi:SMP-30/gluconolactonase/LRE family protein [Candidimonas nitroreducens]|uniref:Gluconolaconase n=1 Tax=Candidimonas nitroreducens TaxID=683354 RepID=A0A225M7G4_9BURK|nr:SMP-30/gluconolactonase/LRE family protein [Candidimonas nitroreducens]OWT56173.1 gluconolaconase [Candidimonas nitroreducens]